jgi:hypothetical protein
MKLQPKCIRFFRHEVLDRWNQLNPDDVFPLNGERDELIGLLQDRFGFSYRRAETEVDQFLPEFQQRIERALKAAA